MYSPNLALFLFDLLARHEDVEEPEIEQEHFVPVTSLHHLTHILQHQYNTSTYIQYHTIHIVHIYSTNSVKTFAHFAQSSHTKAFIVCRKEQEMQFQLASFLAKCYSSRKHFTDSCRPYSMCDTGCMYFSIEHELIEEDLEHVNESLTVLLVALQTLSNEQNQLQRVCVRVCVCVCVHACMCAVSAHHSGNPFSQNVGVFSRYPIDIQTTCTPTVDVDVYRMEGCSN